MVQKIIWILLCLVAVRAQAECQDIRLDVGGSMSALPVFDQATPGGEKDMNLCYAVAAAQLIDASRFAGQKATTAEMTSPWWLALNYSVQFKTRNDNADIEFGETDKALESAKRFGLCRQEDLFENRSSDEIIAFHAKLKKSFRAEDRENSLHALLSETQFFKDPVRITEVASKVSKERTFLSFLRTLFDEKCQGKVYQEPSFTVERMDLDRKPIPLEAKQDLIRQTLVGQQPLEASICSQALSNPEYRGILDSGKFARDCMRHSVLIVGSRSQKGQCQYLVRDTYGAQSCQRKRNGSSWYHSSLECDSGQVWVPEKILFDNTWGVTRILKSGPATVASHP